MAWLIDVSDKSLDNYLSGKQETVRYYQTALRMCVLFEFTRSEAEEFLRDVGHPSTTADKFDNDKRLAYAVVLYDPALFKKSISECNKLIVAHGGKGI